MAYLFSDVSVFRTVLKGEWLEPSTILEIRIDGELVYRAPKPPTSNARLLVSRNKREGRYCMHIKIREP